MKNLVIYVHGKGGNADYVRENPIEWSIPTKILYGSNDNLTSLETMREFARKIGSPLTVMCGRRTLVPYCRTDGFSGQVG